MRRRSRAWPALIAAGVAWAGAETERAARAAPFLMPPPGPSSPATAPSAPTDPSAPPAPYAPPPPPAPYPPRSNPYAHPPYAYPPYPPPPPSYPVYTPTNPYPYGQVRPWDPEVQERRRAAFHNHDGFYLNLGAGILFARNTVPNAAARTEASGTGLALTGALGGAVAKNLILCVRFQVSETDAHFTEAGGAYEQPNASAESLFLGGGLVYYLEDTNVFFAGVIGLSSFDVRDEVQYSLTDTRSGFGAALDLGREWWISPNWGIGVAARGSYGTAKDLSQADASWQNLGLSLLFSATYN